MKKNIFKIIVGIAFILSSILLTIFAMPNQTPLIFNFNEKIAVLSSKYLLFINILLITLFLIFSLVLKNKIQKTIFNFLFWLTTYETMLALCYFCTITNFENGQLCEIPFAVSILFPISFSFVVYSNMLKSAPFKSFYGIRNKYSIQTEFLWTQTQISAKEIFFALGIFTFLISIIFIFIRMFYIGLIVDFLGIVISLLLIKKQTKVMYLKYEDMKNRKEKLNSKM